MDPASSKEANPQRRRSTRLVQAIPLMVIGTDALGQPFKERTSTLLISCHGCRFQSKHYVPVDAPVTLEVPRPEAEHSPRSVQARVVWVQRPRTIRELFQIGVEFDEPGNLWGIAFPPKDWLPAPEEGPAISAPASAPAAWVAERAAPPEDTAPTTPAPVRDDKVRTLPPPAVPMPVAMARQMARLLAESKQYLQKTVQDGAAAAVAEQLRATRDQLDAHVRSAVQATAESTIAQSLEQTIERAVERAFAAKMENLPTAAPATPARIRDDNASTLPPPAELMPMGMARHMARLLAESKQHLQKTLQDGAAAAVADQMLATRDQLDAQVRSVVEATAESTIARSLEQTIERAVERALTAKMESLPPPPSPEELVRRFEGAARSRLAEWQKELEDVSGQLRRQFQNAINQTEADAQKTLEASRASLEETRLRAAASMGAAEQAVARAEESAAQLAAATQSKVEEARDQVDALLGAQFVELGRRADGLIAERARRLEPSLEETAQQVLARVGGQFGGQLEQQLAPHVARAQQAAADLASAEKHAEQALAHASGQLKEQLEKQLAAHLERAQQAAASLASAEQQAEQVLAHASGQFEEQLEKQLAAHFERAQQAATSLASAEQHAEQVLADASGRLDEQLERRLAAHLQRAHQAATSLASAEEHAEQVLAGASRRLDEQLEKRLAAHLQRAHQATIDLAAAEQHAEEAARALRDRIQQTADQAAREALDGVRQQTAGYPAEFEQACRAALSKLEKELEAKITEVTHTAFEALYKSSEWYQRKAQTSMQSTLEKLLEQTSGGLRDRAAEVSRLFASELENYSRNYAEHTRGLMEESAKETSDRTRGQLSQITETTMASFGDELHGVGAATLEQFEQATREAAERSHAVYQTQCTNSLVESRKRLRDEIDEAVNQARHDLQPQLLAFMEKLRVQFEVEQRASLERFGSASNEAIEKYRVRLENASNSWLLASATSLGQHSQAVLETLAEAAEKRLRDTCSQVFAGLGEVLRQRLAGLSTEVQPPSTRPEEK